MNYMENLLSRSVFYYPQIQINAKKVLAIFCFFLICANIKAESVFSLDPRTDIPLGALAVGVFASSLFIENPPSQIPHSLGRSDVNSLDRSMMFTRINAPVRSVSDVTMFSMAVFSPLLPILYNFDTHFNMNTLATYAVMYTQATLLAYGTRVLLKNNITRFRPFLHDGRELSATDTHNSFPSGHTCVAFMSATFFTTAFLMENPDSEWRWPLIVGSHTLAASVGAMRVISGMHFFTDVITGAVLGSFFGWLVPYLHRSPGNNNFPVIVTGNGLMVSLRI